MRARLSAGAVLLGALAILPGLAGAPALAQPAPESVPSAAPSASPSAAATAAPSAAPTSAPSSAPSVAPTSAPIVAAPPVAAPKGAIVVAVDAEAGPAARALAKEVYREAALRPSLDEFTAKLLTGDAATEARATGKLKELAEIRAAVARAGSEAASRHLLASLGSELSAVLVVAVSLDGDRPLARALRTQSAAFEGAPLAGLRTTLEYGSIVYSWPGATTTLLALFPSSGPLKPTAEPSAGGPLKSSKKPTKEGSKEGPPFWASPWFWGTVGGVTAVGITVFILSKTTSNRGAVHIDGTVGP